MIIEKSDQPDAFLKFEHDGWEANSAGYDRHFSDLTGQAVAPTLDAAGVEAGMRVLDVCTGPGMLARGAAGRGASAVGLDFAAQAVAAARARIAQAEFVQGDAQALPRSRTRASTPWSAAKASSMCPTRPPPWTKCAGCFAPAGAWLSVSGQRRGRTTASACCSGR